MTVLADIPFSPLIDIIGRWPSSYLDAIHLWLADNAGAPTLASKIVNGGFDVWQLGPGPFATSGYTADQWQLFPGGGATISATRTAFVIGQTAVPGEPRFYATLARTVVGAASSLFQQPIESVRTLAGQQCVLSFYAKANIAQTITANLVQVFGSGGAPSGNTSTNLGNFALTTAWQKFSFSVTLPSLSGKTIGTNSDDTLTVQFELPVSAGVVTVDLANVDLRAGSTAGAFEYLPLGLIQTLCQRYLWKTYNIDTVPGAITSAGVIGGIATPGNSAFINAAYGIRMRVSPSVTIYNHATGAAGSWRDSGGGDRTTTLIETGPLGSMLVFGTVAASGNIQGHVLASARY